MFPQRVPVKESFLNRLILGEDREMTKCDGFGTLCIHISHRPAFEKTAGNRDHLSLEDGFWSSVTKLTSPPSVGYPSHGPPTAKAQLRTLDFRAPWVAPASDWFQQSHQPARLSHVTVWYLSTTYKLGLKKRQLIKNGLSVVKSV